MNASTTQICFNCRHTNPVNETVCELCGWVLAKEGVTLAPPNSSEGSNEKTIAPQGLSSFNLETRAPDSTFFNLNNAVSAETNNPDPMAHFKIESVLGQGGMGAIYKAQDLTLQRFVALKLFRSDITSSGSGGQQLLDEARLACKLNHPNIVTIYDIARGQGSDFIVMEWVNGQSLDRLIPSKGLELTKALEYACQIADGLACAHKGGIIHRDIKPQNIMLTKEGRIKILDFGIADLLKFQAVSSEDSAASRLDLNKNNGVNEEQDLTQISDIVGTPKYMAPEQALGQVLDQRADIFSFGILFYQMLSGQRPFDSNEIEELKRQLSNGDYRPIKELCPQLPNEVVVLLEKMLATDKSERWQASAELADALHQLYDDLTQRKNWWQQRHWLSKTAMVLPFIFVLGWSVNEVVFPPTTEELIERQLLEATKIAILPFENVSGDPLLQIFSDGLVIALGSDLAQVGREQGDGTTWVIPSSEIRRMKEPNVQKISDKFGVDLLLTGSVQHMGSTRRIVLNLLNSKDGRQLKTTEISIDASSLFQGHNTIRLEAIDLLGWTVSSLLVEKFSRQRPQFDGAYKEYIEGQAYTYRYDQEGNLSKALQAFRSAIDIDQSYENAYESLAEVQFLYFRKTKDTTWLDKMELTIKQLTQLNPNHDKIAYLFAEIAMNKGEYQKAISLYEISTNRNPLHIKSQIGLAKAYSKVSDMEKAESTFLTAYKNSPNNWRVISSFGTLHFKNGNYQEALSLFKRLVIVSPNNDYGYKNMAAIYYSLGNVESAIAYTRKAIELRPTDMAYSNLGTMLFYNQKYEESIIAFKKAVELNDSSYLIWGNLGDAYKLADSYERTSAYQRALEGAKKSLTMNPKDTTAIAHIAYYLANLNQVKKAVSYAKQINRHHSGLENFVVATAYELLGLTKLTFMHLEFAIDKRYPVEEIVNTPMLKASRQDKRFKLLIK